MERECVTICLTPVLCCAAVVVAVVAIVAGAAGAACSNCSCSVPPALLLQYLIVDIGIVHRFLLCGAAAVKCLDFKMLLLLPLFLLLLLL